MRRPPVRDVVDVERLALRGEWRGSVSMAADAGAYLAAHARCAGIERVHLGFAVARVYGVFLVRADAADPGRRPLAVERRR